MGERINQDGAKPPVDQAQRELPSGKKPPLTDQERRLKRAESRHCRRLSADTPNLKEEGKLLHEHKLARKALIRNQMHLQMKQSRAPIRPNLSKRHPRRALSPQHGAYVNV